MLLRFPCIFTFFRGFFTLNPFFRVFDVIYPGVIQPEPTQKGAPIRGGGAIITGIVLLSCILVEDFVVGTCNSCMFLVFHEFEMKYSAGV